MYTPLPVSEEGGANVLFIEFSGSDTFQSCEEGCHCPMRYKYSLKSHKYVCQLTKFANQTQNLHVILTLIVTLTLLLNSAQYSENSTKYSRMSYVSG